ncbi:hypothetical protein [uncultured Bradyrhizobium sp.]|uniref:hypothetical protein n=1 Tax=uncultured Bradyrhizobium sp. TaxID=199684 RepID=UPI0035CBC270
MLAGISNVNGALISRSGPTIGKRQGFMEDRLFPRLDAGSPPWHPAIHCLSGSQNVAGLWLLYGASP